MTALLEDFEHRTGEHCASTAFSNVLRYHGLELSEGMVVGLAAGLSFIYIRGDDVSPTRMIHGRSFSLESDLCEIAALPVRSETGLSDELAQHKLEAALQAGNPVILSTDTFYLRYQNTTSHFPGHRAVVVGHDDSGVWMADRKLAEYQRVSSEELRSARNAPDYPMSCNNEYHHFDGELRLGRPLAEAIRLGMQRNAAAMLHAHRPVPGGVVGVQAMREAADDLPDWAGIADWSWASRFGYQVVIKRGAGGHFFRSLYRDFLAEACEAVPALDDHGLVERMANIADAWVEFAGLLKEQSERESVSRDLFERAAGRLRDLADREEAFFTDLAAIADRDEYWEAVE